MAAKPKAYMLRTVSADMSSYKGSFIWPESGSVKCSDWNDRPECGGGLHGLLWGEGDGSLLDWSDDARWLVVEVDPASVVNIGDKVKVPSGKVVYCGDRKGATDEIIRLGASGPVVGSFNSGGEGSTNSGGYGSVLIFQWWDGKRYRIAVGYVGEDGIEPNVAYLCTGKGELVKA